MASQRQNGSPVLPMRPHCALRLQAMLNPAEKPTSLLASPRHQRNVRRQRLYRWPLRLQERTFSRAWASRRPRGLMQKVCACPVSGLSINMGFFCFRVNCKTLKPPPPWRSMGLPASHEGQAVSNAEAALFSLTKGQAVTGAGGHRPGKSYHAKRLLGLQQPSVLPSGGFVLLVSAPSSCQP